MLNIIKFLIWFFAGFFSLIYIIYYIIYGGNDLKAIFCGIFILISLLFFSVIELEIKIGYLKEEINYLIDRKEN